jgi:predicted SAM-dependent methyltransferase
MSRLLAPLRRLIGAPVAPASPPVTAAAGAAGTGARPRPRQSFAPSPGEPLRLHVGCGDQRLAGWVNIDLQDLPTVDVVADATRGLQFTGAEAVYAEHFLEHLAIDDAVAFLGEARRALAASGWLRLSTPNLDWVWATHYRQRADPEQRLTMALAVNRAFRAWGHQFLWNREMLAEALHACGFTGLRWCRWGESELPLFQGVERHETYPDAPELPHVLIVEARRGEPQPARLAALRERIERDLLRHLSGRHTIPDGG